MTIKYCNHSSEANNNMIGNVPSEIENFAYLDTWITPFNAELTTGADSLDPFIKLSGSLTHLELQYCKIAGTIPDTIGSMSSLSFLGLGEYRKFRRCVANYDLDVLNYFGSSSRIFGYSSNSIINTEFESNTRRFCGF